MRSCKAATRKPTSRGRLAWIRRRSAESLVVTPGRAAISLQASAREGLAEAQGGLGQATQNDAGPGGADRGETDARAVESRSDQRPSGEGWRRLYQSRAHLSACLERQERRRRTASSLASQRQKIQQAERQEFGARVDSEPRRHRSATFRCRRKKPHRRLGGRYNYRCQSQRRCHVACRTKIQIHQARQAAGQERGLYRTGLRARAFAARRPHQNNHLRQWKRVRLSRRDRNLPGVAILFCQTLSLVGTRPQRTHQWPIQTVLPKGLRSLYCVRYRCPKGRG